MENLFNDQVEETPPLYLKGRGAQINTPNRFDPLIYDKNPTVTWEDDQTQIRTQYTEVHAKSIVNKVESSDIGMEYSMNPYQGCEHGCVYCYARNTHSYWGYSAGLDFEQKILVKKDAPALLAKKLRSKKWEAAPIMLSGNTDCYQPIERKLEITRKILQIFWQFRHPVGLITKNNLILRDLDILSKLAENQLVKAAISLTTLNPELQNKLEPRTAHPLNRLKAIEKLAKHGIPVNVMLAPIIPGLNDHEILTMAKAAADRGATSITHIVVRLNGDVGEIFTDWLTKNFPDRAEKVLNKIKDTHGGQLNDSREGKRMVGEGNIAKIIQDQVKLARRKYFKNQAKTSFNLELYGQFKNPQMRLF